MEKVEGRTEKGLEDGEIVEGKEGRRFPPWDGLKEEELGDGWRSAWEKKRVLSMEKGFATTSSGAFLERSVKVDDNW